jgi:hypothetical protein
MAKSKRAPWGYVSDLPRHQTARRDRRALTSKRSKTAAHETFRWVTGPTLRGTLNISAVTLWRWRHRGDSGFPFAKNINGRLYFYWPDVQAWLDKQPVAA